jgi:hypothetical protein
MQTSGRIFAGLLATTAAATMTLAGGGPASAIVASNPKDASKHIVTDPVRFGYVGRFTLAAPGATTFKGACTASLIQPAIALTAHHCFENYRSGDVVRLAFGGVRLTTGADVHTVAPPVGATEARAVNWRFSKDLAVVLLDKPITNITPALLAEPKDASLWKKNAPVEFLGWGTISASGRNVISAELRRATGKVVGLGPASVTGPAGSFNSSFIETTAAGDLPGRIGAGDSGGPLLANQAGVVKQIGITSRSRQQFVCDNPLPRGLGYPVCQYLHVDLWTKTSAGDESAFIKSASTQLLAGANQPPSNT